MENQDIRWKQRFEHFSNAFKQLKFAKKLRNERNFTELEAQGVVQAFEITQELSWKVLKDYLEEQGTTDLFGSKNVVREAFNVGLISNGEIWLDMIKTRNLTSHIYDESEISKLLVVILNIYIDVFRQFEDNMKSKL